MMLAAPVKPVVVARRRPYRPLSVRADWQTGIDLTGKALGLFALFLSTTNWWFYRRVREEAEKNQKK
jgi:hypothetical protein